MALPRIRLKFSDGVRLFRTTTITKADGGKHDEKGDKGCVNGDSACVQDLDQKPKEECVGNIKNLETKRSICQKDPCKKEECPDDALCVLDTPPCCPVEDLTTHPDKVVVIGAGLAGLSAANRLLEHGVPNITILESSHRVGGRIMTQFFGDAVIEAGGEFNIEGVQPNFWDQSVVYQAEKAGLIRYPVTKESIVQSLITEPDGRSLPLPAAMMAFERMKRILCVGESLKVASGFSEKGKAIEYVGVRMKQELRMFPEEVRPAAAKVMAAMVILATDRTYVSPDGQGTYISIPGSDMRVPLGSTNLIGPLLKNLQDGKIKFGVEVQTICWGTIPVDGKRALIKTVDGSEFGANYVVFTPSLGVLKDRAHTLFCPSLPGFKMEAIEKTQFLLENKLFARFREPIWSWRDEPINIEYSESEVAGMQNWLQGLRRLYEVQGSETVIRLDLAGEGAAMMEKESEPDLADCIRDFLSQYLGKTVPRVTQVLRSTYCSSPEFRGSRSTSGECGVQLAAALPTCVDPSPPVLFFAGEHTAGPLAGTIAGAIASGIREADKVSEAINRQLEDTSERCARL